MLESTEGVKMRGIKQETNGSAKLSKVVIYNNTWHKKLIVLLTISMLYCHRNALRKI